MLTPAATKATGFFSAASFAAVAEEGWPRRDDELLPSPRPTVLEIPGGLEPLFIGYEPPVFIDMFPEPAFIDDTKFPAPAFIDDTGLLGPALIEDMKLPTSASINDLEISAPAFTDGMKFPFPAFKEDVKFPGPAFMKGS